MSWPVTIYKCTHCDFEQGDSNTWGRREYLLDDGVRVSVPRQRGWCFTCQAIVATEDLSGHGQRQEINGLENAISNLGFWRIGRRRELRRKMADLRDILLLQKQRQSPARCLLCGSTEIDTPSTKIISEGLVQYVAREKQLHPSCGGVFEERTSDLRIALRQSVTRYTPEGIFIECVYVEGYSVPDKAYFETLKKENAQIRASRV